MRTPVRKADLSDAKLFFMKEKQNQEQERATPENILAEPAQAQRGLSLSILKAIASSSLITSRSTICTSAAASSAVRSSLELYCSCLSLGRFPLARHITLSVDWPRHITLFQARSRLYRNEILHPNTHFSAFFKIYRTIQLNFQKMTKFAKNRKKSHFF